ncbi:rod shape-determining protein MreD [Nocardioides campestrisoli]|uniref:rod shape-determining protein MreD n=1 Tax=Nocardioides campestrisoli TaxID=2736757 RepID=UPI0015E7D269|nr:rod shape-determining protein MreD [Nocardioides campestrisoli]
MSLARAAVGLLVVLLALALQVSLFPHLAWQGVVPNLVLLVVVAAALSGGAQFALLLGFAGGVLLDLAPPADHVAGRWALSLVLVAWIASRVRQETRPSTLAVLGCVAASSFIGTSVFALSGLVLGEPLGSVPEILGVIAVAVLWDLLLTPFVLPWAMKVFDRLTPAGRERARA